MSDREGGLSVPAVLRERGLWLSLLLALVVLLFCYQIGSVYNFSLGSFYDPLYVADGWNADEQGEGYRYRWTTAEASFRLTNFGYRFEAGDYELDLVLQGYRSGADGPLPPPTVTVSLNNQPLAVISTTAAMNLQTVAVPARLLLTAGPDPQFTLSTATFNPPGDSRNLGVKVRSIILTKQGVAAFPLHLPPALVLILSVLLSVLLYTIYRATQRRLLRGLGLIVISYVGMAYIAAAPLLLPILYTSVAVTLAINGLLYRHQLASSWGGWLERLKNAQYARRWFLPLLAIYAVLALYLVWQVDFIGHADYADNAVVARNILHGKGASVDYLAQFYTRYPTVSHPAETWPLLQPLLTVPFFAVFGDSTTVAKLPNYLLVLVLAYSVFWIGCRLWDGRVGFFGAILAVANPYVLSMLVYPISDLVTVVLFVWLAYLVGTQPQMRPSQAEWGLEVRRWMGVGLLAGLLVWAKPSMVVALAAIGGWVLWRLWQGRTRADSAATAASLGQRLKSRLQHPLVLGVLVAGLVVSPLLTRNLLTFHTPLYSTEQYDAWVIKYGQWENIYCAYSFYQPGKQTCPLSERGELPNRSWLLRYGFDQLYKVDGYELGALWDGGRVGGGAGLVGGDVGSTLAVMLALLGLLVAGRGWRTPPQLSPPPLGERAGGELSLAPLLLSFAALAGFLVLYWHYEARYFQIFAPFVALFAVAFVFWLGDRVRPNSAPRHEGSRRLAMLLVPLLLLLLLYPPMREQWETAPKFAGATPLVAAAQWYAQHSTPTDVIMSRNPWEFSFHSTRPALMIANNSAATILEVGDYYKATYLHLDQVRVDPNRRFRPALNKLYNPSYKVGDEPVKGYLLVYRDQYTLIYKLTPGRQAVPPGG